MTSPLTSRCMDRLSVWIVCTHYAVDDFVKIWSYLDKNCGKRSILKVVTSRVWRHRVTWGHRGGHHSVAPHHFPIVVTYALCPLVSEIFDLKVADTQTNRQTEFHADW